MDPKIQELTEKIYQEGVEKGNVEAERILSKAQSEKEQLLSEAQKQADEIIAKAQKQAAELTKNTQAELKLFAGQAVEGLKTEIANLISQQIAEKSVASATDQKEFMAKIILSIATEWAKKGNLTIGTEDAQALKNYFQAQAKELLDQKVKIETVNGLRTAFEIAPQGGSYKVVFGSQEFIDYFKAFLRPELVKMLF